LILFGSHGLCTHERAGGGQDMTCLIQIAPPPDSFTRNALCRRGEADPIDAQAVTALRDMLFEIARLIRRLFPVSFGCAKTVCTPRLADALAPHSSGLTPVISRPGGAA